MDGITKAKLQEEIGVREIVEDIDLLRMKLGFENVVVLTPKVEVRLRSAQYAQIPMKVSLNLGDSHKIEIGFPRGFPSEPLQITALDDYGETDEHLTGLLSEYASRETTEGHSLRNHSDSESADESSNIYPRALDVLAYFRERQPKPQPDQPNDAGAPSETPDAHDISIPPSSSAAQEHAPHNDAKYTCMKCGTLLFKSEDLETHEPSDRDMHRRGGQLIPCTSVFISAAPEFLDKSKLTENSGRIECPKCESKVGSWCWTGTQCSCGSWVIPAFQFTKSKIDEKKLRIDLSKETVFGIPHVDP
jgi:DNA-directed RNA polymerase subunit RPC12/RpoP